MVMGWPTDIEEAYRRFMSGDYQSQVKPPKPDAVPPDPTTGRVTAWGNAYPCLRIKPEGMKGFQCPGMMQRTHKRAYRFDGDLWYHFKCDRCGRQADDRKVRDASSSPA